MKCLLLSSRRYSFTNSIIKGFIDNGLHIELLDYEQFFLKIRNDFINRTGFFPEKIKKYWKKPYVDKINKQYVKIYKNYYPDLVFIYNNQNILPQTLEYFKKNSKIVFLLGDHPIYTPTNIYNLHILFFADYIICPDSFWCEQLKKIGINNVFFDCFCFNPEVYFPFTPDSDEFEKYKSDFVYIGSAHKGNWGYKRFLFLNHFIQFNLKAFMNGDGYSGCWEPFFPELKSCIIRHDSYDQQFNNLVYNCSKISPVELTPSLFNGIQIRVFDILGSGIFPLCEYSVDLENVFKGINIPFIKSYNEALNTGRYLLKNDRERKFLVKAMREVVIRKYSPEMVIKRILSYLFD